MNLKQITEIKVVPKFTEADTSKKGFINKQDIQKIVKDTVIFFAAPLLMYLGQLTMALQAHTALTLSDLVPSAVTQGAIEGWLLGIAINYLLKLNNGKQ